ncbi:hypothetical protein JHK87_054404 [Glycine soja]|nr:hypothetical protein JHK87_054404 [Glycine soja]
MDTLHAHGRGVPAGQRDQPAHLSHDQVHQLRCAAEEHCPLLSPRSLLLQLPAWRPGQPLQPWLQCHHQVQELNLLFSIFFYFKFSYSGFIVYMTKIQCLCIIVLLPINNCRINDSDSSFYFLFWLFKIRRCT